MFASEIVFLQKKFSSRNRYRLYTPISYLVHRTPDYFARGDVCLDGAGGFCLGLKFWWFFPWPQSITILTLKHFRTSVRIEPTKFISINLLEYITIILTYAGAIEALRQLTASQTLKYPLLELASDNTSAVAWTKKAVLSNNIGKRLAQVFCRLKASNELGLSACHIAGVDNTTADKISRMSNSSFSSEFRTLLQEHPELRLCRRFHPNTLLVSSLMQMLLLEQTCPDLIPKPLGHFSPG